MTIHARSDVSAVTISPDSGGCGQFHSRPVNQGAPVKLWSLACEPCESLLINDPHWSRTISGIPETPDEKAYREDQETKGLLDQQNQTAEALAKLGSLGDLPSAIAQLANMFSGEPKRERRIATLKSCTGCGSAWSADVKFCPECGLRADVEIPKAAGGYGPDAPDDEEPDSAVGAHIDVAALSYQQLKELAIEQGVTSPHTMKKADLVRVLSGS